VQRINEAVALASVLQIEAEIAAQAAADAKFLQSVVLGNSFFDHRSWDNENEGGDFIGREDLIAAVSAWLLEKSKPLEEILLEKNMLDQDCHQLLEALVVKHLEQHENDPEKSLAAVSSLDSIREELRKLEDSDLEASLLHVSFATDVDFVPTYIPSVGLPTSDGGRFQVLRPHASGGLGKVSSCRRWDGRVGDPLLANQPQPLCRTGAETWESSHF